MSVRISNIQSHFNRSKVARSCLHIKSPVGLRISNLQSRPCFKSLLAIKSFPTTHYLPSRSSTPSSSKSSKYIYRIDFFAFSILCCVFARVLFYALSSVSSFPSLPFLIRLCILLVYGWGFKFVVQRSHSRSGSSKPARGQSLQMALRYFLFASVFRVCFRKFGCWKWVSGWSTSLGMPVVAVP